jgi:hypothetical protein
VFVALHTHACAFIPFPALCPPQRPPTPRPSLAAAVHRLQDALPRGVHQGHEPQEHQAGGEGRLLGGAVVIVAGRRDEPGRRCARGFWPGGF